MSKKPEPKRQQQLPSHPTPGPWRWVNWGGDWSLASMAATRPIVLTQLTTRDAGPPFSAERVLAAGCQQDGLRVLAPLTPDHPDARLIAAAPALLAACEEALSMAEHSGNAPGVTLSSVLDVLRAAVKEATGK